MTRYVSVDGMEIVGTMEVSAAQQSALLAAYPSPLDGWMATTEPVSNATHYYDAPDFIAYTEEQCAEKSNKPSGYEAEWSNITFSWDDVTDLSVRIEDSVRTLRQLQDQIATRQGNYLRRVMLAVLAAAVLWMGVYPKPFTDVMNVSVAELLKHVAASKLQ